MALNFQSSFIPKEQVTEGVFKKKKIGIVGIVAFSLFITSIVISIGIYFYKNIVKNDIHNLEAQLAEAEQKIDKKTINEMTQFSKKLTTAKSIVFRHQVISNFLASLASSTVSTVQFTGFDYGTTRDGGLSVALQGKAVDYASVALQESIFSQNKYFKSVVFSNLSLSDKGLVGFDLTISVDPQIFVYSP